MFKKIKNPVAFGRKWDSEAELEYYQHLIGIYGIENIELQPKFELIPQVKFKDKNKRTQTHITYSPDFKIGNKIIEYKGHLNPDARLKIKLFNWKYPEFDFEVISENPDKNSSIRFVTYDEAQKYLREQKKKKEVKKVSGIKKVKKVVKNENIGGV